MCDSVAVFIFRSSPCGWLAKNKKQKKTAKSLAKHPTMYEYICVRARVCVYRIQSQSYFRLLSVRVCTAAAAGAWCWCCCCYLIFFLSFLLFSATSLLLQSFICTCTRAMYSVQCTLPLSLTLTQCVFSLFNHKLILCDFFLRSFSTAFRIESSEFSMARKTIRFAQFTPPSFMQTIYRSQITLEMSTNEKN